MTRTAAGFMKTIARAGLALALASSLLPASAQRAEPDLAPPPSRACTRATGPLGITASGWTEPAAARQALAGPGFGRLETKTRGGKRLPVHFYRPTRFDPVNGRVWFVMHGVDRDASRYLRAAAATAERNQVLVIVPEFSRDEYPTSQSYTFGVAAGARGTGMASRGRRPDPDDFTYVEVERVFEAVRKEIRGRQAGYYLFGHSAGAQFTHRLVTFMPCARVLGAVAANAGWYTMPGADRAEPFGMPYSLRGSQLGEFEQRALLSAPLTILVGSRDIREPGEDGNLRGTSAAMAQGGNRLARGRSYYEAGRALARKLDADFQWKLRVAPGAAHNASQVVASAGFLLFDSEGTPPCESTAADAARGVVIEELLVGEPPSRRYGANVFDNSRPGEHAFVELVNAGATEVCLSGWTLEANGHVGHLFPLSRSLRPGTGVVVFDTGVPAGNFGTSEVQRATAATGLGAAVSGGVLTLRDAMGRVATQVSWGDCGKAQCATDHWPDMLPRNRSIVRWPAPRGGWQAHERIAATPASPGTRTDGRPW